MSSVLPRMSHLRSPWRWSNPPLEFQKPLGSWRGGRQRSGLWITLACLIIGLVSAYDAYLTMVYAPFLDELEMNPLGRYIMNLGEGTIRDLRLVARFLGLKFGGTVIVLTTIQTLYHVRRRWAMAVALGLVVFQLSLLWFLQFGTQQLVR